MKVRKRLDAEFLVTSWQLSEIKMPKLSLSLNELPQLGRPLAVEVCLV